jgi:hypothetical protein
MLCVWQAARRSAVRIRLDFGGIDSEAPDQVRLSNRTPRAYGYGSHVRIEGAISAGASEGWFSGKTASDRFNAIATLVREILYAFASFA